MSEATGKSRFWHGVLTIWRFETRRLWTWRRAAMVFGLAALGAAVAVGARYGVSLLLHHHVSSGAVLALVAISAYLLPIGGEWVSALAFGVSPEWLQSPMGITYVVFSSVLIASMHYVLPGVAGLAIAEDGERGRLDMLRMTQVTSGQLLVGKWLAVVTPFALFWLAIVPLWVALSLDSTHSPLASVASLASSVLDLATVAMLGLYASARCRSVGTALVVSYALCWAVPAVAGLVSVTFSICAARTQGTMADHEAVTAMRMCLGLGARALMALTALHLARRALERRWSAH